MNSAGLRKLFKRSIRNKWNLSELEVALDLAADAWEEDQQTTADLRLVLQEQGGAMLSLRKRLEAAETTAKLLAGMLSTFGRFSTMHPEDVLAEFSPPVALAHDKPCPGCGVVGVNVHTLGCPAALAGEESPDATKNATRTDKSPEGYSIDS